MSTPDPDFLLRLRPLAGYGWSIAPEQRLRGALKVLLRRFGMRCVECKPSTEATGHDGKPRLASSEPSEAELLELSQRHANALQAAPGPSANV